MKLTFTVPATSEVEFADLASAFSDETSKEQAIILEEFFDALKFKCGDSAKFETQLCWIAKEIELKDFKNLVYVINTLHEFLKGDDRP